MLTPKEKLDELNGKFKDLCEALSSKLFAEYRITSGLRTPARNAIIGGVRDSSHEAGLALDVAHDGDIIKAMKLVYWLGRLGVVRVGFYDKHVHFDIDETKPQVQWEGRSK